MRPVRAITAEEENFRTVRFASWSGGGMVTSRRDPVEPEPVGTYVVMVFKITGYDPDCDGSLMARLASVNRHGEPTGWEPTHLGLYPDTDLVVTEPEELWKMCDEQEHVGGCGESTWVDCTCWCHKPGSPSD
jgi:hypothetical protein